ncbi:uncharacterized protein CDAR_519491 [Caerostris darwini]|uniref:Uncharacterized protein n=1 Tax=Caerostris darwini TaxID=1538125 RepID=A0AAV4WZ44_9ARAC|nr:uncharacterized protein CDAR_519491 [Caerostris darwini]
MSFRSAIRLSLDLLTEALSILSHQYTMNLRIAIGLLFLMFQLVSCDVWEDTYNSVGCKGTYDKYKMAHLERVCDECYELYKKQDIHINCRSHCFGSATFFKCMEMVALNELRKQQVMHSWDVLRRIN